MKREYRARLRVNETFLEEKLEVEPVLDLCCQGKALTLTDLERVRAERSRPDRVVLLLKILASKEDDKCYETFRDALGDPSVDQLFIREQLDSTPLPDDALEGKACCCIFHNGRLTTCC